MVPSSRRHDVELPTIVDLALVSNAILSAPPDALRAQHES
jgi:hypothetical protein